MFSVLLIGIVTLCLASVSSSQETSLTRVLFVGNSYLYYNDSLHNHVKRMVAERYPETPSRRLAYKSAANLQRIKGARV